MGGSGANPFRARPGDPVSGPPPPPPPLPPEPSRGTGPAPASPSPGAGGVAEDAVLGALRVALGRVRERIARAAARSGRSADAVTLVVVTKGVPAAVVALLPSLGVTDIGESRVQEAVAKRETLSALPLRWHMIGHLQTNKVRRALESFHRVHSVDRDVVLDALAAEAARRGRVVDCLLQVNVSGESTKGGYRASDVAAALHRARALASVRVTGLMTIPAPATAGADAGEPFRALRALRDGCRTGPDDLPDLSMGMSGDFEAAVEEGATLLRVGSAIFDGLPPSLFSRATADAGGR